MSNHLGPSPPYKILALTVATASLPLLLLALFPNPLYWIADVPPHLLFHNAAECLGIMGSLSIFGVGWLVYDLSLDRHTLFLGTAFLAIGLEASMGDFMRNQLREALECLDSEHIARLLLQVGDHDPSLRKILPLLADNYDYPTILKTLTVNE